MAPRAKSAAPGPADGPLPPVVLVHGTDSFLVEEKADEVLTRIAPGWREDEFKVQRVNGLVDRVDDALAALRAVRAAMLQPGFFASDPVGWLRGLSFSAAPTADRTSKSEAVRAALDDFRAELRANGTPPGVSLLVTSANIAKNSGLYKSLQAMEKEGRAAIFDVGGGGADSARRLVERRLAENGWTMSAAVRAAFVARVGSDGGTVVSELEKLFAYTGGAEPTAEDVAEICSVSTEGEIWEISDVFGRRDVTGTIAVVRRLLSNKGSSEMALLRMLEIRIADLALAVDARERGLLAPSGDRWSPALGEADRAAVADLGKADVFARPSFQRGPLLDQARRWTGAQVRRARLALMRAHERMVTQSVDPRALRELAVSEALAT